MKRFDFGCARYCPAAPRRCQARNFRKPLRRTGCDVGKAQERAGKANGNVPPPVERATGRSGSAISAGRSPRGGQATEQLGLPAVPEVVPWKPKLTEPLAPTV